jgi:hypothetical protein
MKISKKSAVEVEKEYKENPPRPKSMWAEVIEKVKDSDAAVEVTELSKGSVAGGARACKEAGLRFRAFYGEGRLLILPSKSEK